MTSFEQLLYEWYRLRARNLPWRDTTDPYRIWISEIILQQTQVTQGLRYYRRFLDCFPDVFALAAATQEEVMMAWQGLGYYSRARNAHLAAKIIVNELDGVFPSDYRSIKSLPGIGEYTAAAIASFAFGLPHAVVDGNVFRFFARFFCIDTPIDIGAGKKIFFEKANEVLDRHQPHRFNQAVMEFGSLVCTAVNPLCDLCPLQHLCKSYAIGCVHQLPVKSKRIERRQRFLNYFIFDLPGGQTVIEQRTGRDIWQGLYQFPLFETSKAVGEDVVFNYLRARHPQMEMSGKAVGRRRHLLTHQELLVTFWRVTTSVLSMSEGQMAVAMGDLSQYPFPQLIVSFLKDNAVE